VLRDVIFDVPYTSVSQFYEYFGDAPAPSAFGASCAFQSFEVGRRLAEAGGPAVRYLVDGRHVAAVVVSEDGLEVLDPYLLHLEPLRLPLDHARPDGTVVASASALPFRQDALGRRQPGRVRAVWRPARGRITLEYTRFSPRRQHHVVSRFFTLATDRALREAPPPADVVRPLLLHPEQNNLGLRVADRGDGALREVVHPLTGPGQGLVARDNEGTLFRSGDRGFTGVLAAVAQTLQLPPEDVVDHLLGGVALHRRVAPPDLDLPPYSLEDE
jgi:hypothetical protein